MFGIVACTVSGQVFVEPQPKGEAWLSFGYGNMFTTKHYLGGGSYPIGDNVESDYGHIRGQSLGLQVGYGVTDRLALSFGIPFFSDKYTGAYPHNRPGDGGQQFIDDGLYHGTFQDYTFSARYQALNGPISVAPFFAAVIPSHSYTFRAHSAAGLDLHEYLLGFGLGASLDRVLPGSYIQATYAYAFVERVLGIYHNRSDFAVELGYSLTESLILRFLGTGHYTHGGFDYKDLNDIPVEYRPYHDQIIRSSAMNLGGGFTYVLTGSTELYATYQRTVMGRGGHKIDQALGFGVTWNFSPKQLIRRYFASKPETLSTEAQ